MNGKHWANEMARKGDLWQKQTAGDESRSRLADRRALSRWRCGVATTNQIEGTRYIPGIFPPSSFY